MLLIRPPMTDLKIPVRADCCYKAAPPSTYESYGLLIAGDGEGELAFGQAFTLSPAPVPASKIKQTFLFTNLTSLLAFKLQAAGPHSW